MPTPRRKAKAPFTARTADRHVLYQEAVQCVEAEIDFVDRTFKKLSGRTPSRLREDFCGTFQSSCEWLSRRLSNTAVAVDLDRPTLDWGLKHNLSKLPPESRRRLTLLNRNVLNPGPKARNVDCILAMNFSYWVFKTRPLLLRYFRSVRDSLVNDGVFFLDYFGGYESFQERQDRRRCKGFTYIWDQARYNPITGHFKAHIHFEFRDKTRMNRAFTYDWRVWPLPELVDLLTDAGFRNPTVYWEGDDGKGGGNGIFRPSTNGAADPSFIGYVTAQK